MILDSPIALYADWPLVSLKDVTTKIGSGATPRGGKESYLAERTRFALVRSQNVFDRHFDTSGLAYISDEQAARLKNVSLQPGDVLLNITGDGVTFGRSCVVPEAILPACVNQHVSIIRADRSCVTPGWILAFLTHPVVKPYIEGFNAGGSRRAVTKGHIESFCLPLPPLAEQCRIASVLGALDDKIELNRRMNETLEEMARALFKSWFVDFDPVRAKMKGRAPYGMDAATAALFPDSFEDSELGPIPKGWHIKPIRDVVEAVFDGPHATPKASEEGPIFLGIKNLTGTRLELSDVKRISEEDWPRWTKRVVPRYGDIVFSYEARLGDFALIPRGIRCCLGRRLALVRPHEARDDTYFLFHYFTASVFQQFLRAHVNPGSTVDRILLKDFPGYPALRPVRELVGRFEEMARQCWARIHANQAESETLAALRGLLLLELLSGQLRTKDAEKYVEAAL